MLLSPPAASLSEASPQHSEAVLDLTDPLAAFGRPKGCLWKTQRQQHHLPAAPSTAAAAAAALMLPRKSSPTLQGSVSMLHYRRLAPLFMLLLLVVIPSSLVVPVAAAAKAAHHRKQTRLDSISRHLLQNCGSCPSQSECCLLPRLVTGFPVHLAFL